MNEWKKVKIGDVATIKHGFAFKGEFFSEQCNNSVVLTPGNFNINGGFKKSKPKYYLGDYPIEYVLSPNDLIVSMTDLSKFGDTLGYSAKIPNDGMSYLHNQRIGFIQKTSENIDLDYLYWLMRCKHYQKYIVNSCSGSTVKHTSPKLISRFEFCLPPLEEQKAIADVLSCLDDKIELNNKINKNLEEQAQALFKRWFVDFEFPNEDGNPYKSSGGEMVDSELGSIPKDWEVKTIDTLGTIVCGKTPSKDKPEYYGNDVSFIKIPDMHNNVFIIKSQDNLSYVGAQSQPNKFISKDSLCVSCIATVGLVSITAEKAQTNQQINSIIFEDKKYLYYAYLFFVKSTEELKNLGRAGTATLNINTTAFSKIRIIIPCYDLIEKFYNVNKDVFNLIKCHMLQNQKLAELRDYLLPKLMSGEIRVKL